MDAQLAQTAVEHTRSFAVNSGMASHTLDVEARGQ